MAPDCLHDLNVKKKIKKKDSVQAYCWSVHHAGKVGAISHGKSPVGYLIYFLIIICLLHHHYYYLLNNIFKALSVRRHSEHAQFCVK